MASLKYRAKLDINPKGKPKVYFSAHEEDFNYFEDISNDIFEYSNCTIWYFDKEEEDYFDCLKQMQLFVMPITTKLLTTKNRAIDIEFKFALENNIPILPLMKESGLEELFNKVCGELQFLDKRKKESTGIKYKDKLKKHLSNVLIGDDLAEKIRAAFDAYIFLSYRKKDRKYAEDLMKLIHKDPLCRDIAIWYDEFLVAGENFNESIKESLQKSDLFLMAVTPNLVNENNYIINIEYPLAKKENKPIVPIEVVPTDKSKANEIFAELPIIINVSDEELTKKLINEIKRVSIESNNTPEHNYFIGLAYLNGIDVEVDNKKGYDLICSAADDGLIAAINKLISIFKHGVGTKINYYQALKWIDKKIIKLNKIENKDDEIINDLFDAYLESSEILIDLLDYKKALNNLMNADKLNVKDLQKNIQLYLQLGSIYEDEYDYEKAQNYYKKALEYSLKLDSSINNNILVANCYHKIGKIHHNNFKYDLALKEYAKANEIFLSINEDERSEEINLDYSTLLKSIGASYSLKNNSIKALEYLEKAYEIGYKLLYTLNGIDYADEFLETEFILGELYQKDSKYKEAEEYFSHVKTATGALMENKGTLDFVLNHIKALNKEGEIYLHKKEKNFAKTSYKDSLDMCLKLVDTSNILSVNKLLSECYLNNGYMHLLNDEYDLALENFDKAHDIANRLLKENNGFEFRKVLYEYYNQMIIYHNHKKEYDRTLSYLLKQEYMFDDIKLNGTEFVQLNHLQITVNSRLMNCYLKLKDKDKAYEYGLKNLELSEGLYNRTKANQQLISYATCLYNMGALSEICKKDFNEANNYYLKCINLLLNLLNSVEIIDIRKTLHKYYEYIKEFYKVYKKSELFNELEKDYLHNKWIIDNVKKAKDQMGYVYAQTSFGYWKYLQGDYKMALMLYKSVLYYLLDVENYKKIGYKDIVSKTLNKLKDIATKLSLTDQANEYKKLSSISEKNIDDEYLQDKLIDINLEICDLLSKEYKSGMHSEEAIKVLNKSIQIRENRDLSIDERVKLATSYYNLADIYYSHLNDYSKSIEYHLKAIEVRKEIVNESRTSFNLEKLAIENGLLAHCAKLLKDYEQFKTYNLIAIEYFEEAYKEFKDNKVLSLMAWYVKTQADYYYEIENNYDEAIKYMRYSLDLYKELYKNDKSESSLEEVKDREKELNEIIEKSKLV